jgi:transcriptional regulator with XRE-family HTH domain
MAENKVLKILREQNNYSQEYVASILNISQNTYSNLEAGRSKLTVDRVKLLAELYKIEPEYFVSDDLPIVNYNTGTYSKGIVNSERYHEGSESQKELYSKLLMEKDEQNQLLRSELNELRKEKAEILVLLNKLSARL